MMIMRKRNWERTIMEDTSEETNGNGNLKNDNYIKEQETKNDKSEKEMSETMTILEKIKGPL